jgi:hypothetical protein
MKSKTNDPPGLFNEPLFHEDSNLRVVLATFEEVQESSFEALVAGYTSLRVLTYSNSVSIINRTAALVDELEVVFGREDILNGMAQYLHYQELLIKELIAEVRHKDNIRQKIDDGKIALFVVTDQISHEKLFLLEGEQGRRVITGSANFSDKAFSGTQNESYICFDNDEKAWTFFSAKYERIKQSSTMKISRKAVLAEQFDIENLPIWAPNQPGGDTPQIIVVQDKPPAPTVIQKVLSQKTPRPYVSINGTLESKNGVVRVDRTTASRAIQYVKSNARTEEENPQEYLSIDPDEGHVILSGKLLDLQVAPQVIQSDVEILLQYFQGYSHFRGDADKLASDYFTFMSWFYISPLICDFRNRALARGDYILDYPIFGLLYGKSNCGKSELIRTLLISMFEQESFLKNDWFTKSQIPTLREQNRRFPMVFDDLDKMRFQNHAIALIKDDYVSLKEYPVAVLSMNAEKDTFESEVRKRCLIIYTGASLPDHTGESRRLANQLKRLKKNLSNSLYREYLRRALSRLQRETPTDILKFSSTILVEIFQEYSSSDLPAWCRIMTMDDYIHTKHDKVKEELLQLWQYNPSAWNEKGNKVILKLDDIHSSRKLLKDIPDYLTTSGSRGDIIIFNKEHLEEFLEIQIGPASEESLTAKSGFMGFLSRLMGREG